MMLRELFLQSQDAREQNSKLPWLLARKTGYVADVKCVFLRQPDQETFEESETVAER